MVSGSTGGKWWEYESLTAAIIWTQSWLDFFCFFHRRFTELKQYSDELNTVISHLLRVRAVGFYTHTHTRTDTHLSLTVCLSLAQHSKTLRKMWVFYHQFLQLISSLTNVTVQHQIAVTSLISDVTFHLKCQTAEIWHWALISPSLFQKVADRLYGVYKVHGNYGRVFR